MKKVVVVYPYPHVVTESGATVYIGATSSDRLVYVDQKTFEANEELSEDILAENTGIGNLVIRRVRRSPINKPTKEVIAVFKHWIYWENIE